MVYDAVRSGLVRSTNVSEEHTDSCFEEGGIIFLHNAVKKLPGDIFCGEGPRSRCYGRTAVLRLTVQPFDEDDSFFFVFLSNRAPVE
jgi:hypothetical protein